MAETAPLTIAETISKKLNAIVGEGIVQLVTQQNEWQLKGLAKECKKALGPKENWGTKDVELLIVSASVFQLLAKHEFTVQLLKSVLRREQGKVPFGVVTNLAQVLFYFDRKEMSVLLEKYQGAFELDFPQLIIAAGLQAYDVELQTIIGLFQPQSFNTETMQELAQSILSGKVNELRNIDYTDTISNSVNSLLNEAIERGILVNQKIATMFLMNLASILISVTGEFEEEFLAKLDDIPFQDEFSSIFGVTTYQGCDEELKEIFS